MVKLSNAKSQSNTLENYMDYSQNTSGTTNADMERKVFYKWKWDKMRAIGKKIFKTSTMIKLFFLLIIIVSCSSCSKSVFYEYFSNEKNQRYYYATIEITPKNEIIYRGVAYSDYISNRVDNGIMKYNYLYGKNDVNPLNGDYFSLYSKDFYYIKSVLDKDRYGYENKVSCCFLPEQYWFIDDEKMKKLKN